MREIILDTETTGLSPDRGDRVVELACVELMNHLPTGRVYHTYINPERDVPKEAQAIHGLNTDFLKDHPLFRDVAKDFLDFIVDSPLVIHNAEFDLKFLNAELKSLQHNRLPNPIVDTLMMARQKFPGSPASLDALCRRFQIDNKHRTHHGALLDCQLLSAVYLELKGGRQPDFKLAADQVTTTVAVDLLEVYKDKPFRTPRTFG